MHVLHLPQEIIKNVLAYLDIESMVNLYFTFDSRTQRILSSPGAFESIVINRVKQRRLPLLKCFLMAVKDVDSLYFAPRVEWPIHFLPLLTTLNPRYLQLDEGFLHSSVKLFAKAFLIDPSNPKLRRLAELLRPYRLPVLQRLTPRLEALSLCCDPHRLNTNYFNHSLKQAWNRLVPALPLFPSTLTSYSFTPIAGGTWDLDNFAELPLGLRTLRIHLMEENNAIDFWYIFGRFRHLETLEINNIGYFHTSFQRDYYRQTPSVSMLEMDETANANTARENFYQTFDLALEEIEQFKAFGKEVPPHLTSLTLTFSNVSDSPIPLFETLMIHSRLTHLNLQCYLCDLQADRSTLNFNMMLPPSLVSFSLALSDHSINPMDQFAIVLPRNLTRLSIWVSHASFCPLVFSSIGLLLSLTQLSLKLDDGEFFEVSSALPFDSIPRSVEMLVFNVDPFKSPTKQEMAQLPPNLKYLRMYHLDASLFQFLKLNFPKCHFIPLENFLNEDDGDASYGA